MKVTEKVVMNNTIAANASSRHLSVGLKTRKGPSGYSVELVYRVNGAPAAGWFDLSASEANVAVTMFSQLSCIVKDDGIKEVGK